MAKINNNLLMQLESKMVETKVLKLKVNGKPIDITVEKKFLNTKIEELFKEIIAIKLHIENGDYPKLDEMRLLYIMMIKTFSNTPFLESGTLEEKLENYIKTVNALINLECEDGISVFEKIMSEFEQAQIEKITKKMSNTTKNINEFIKSEQEKMSEDVMEVSEDGK